MGAAIAARTRSAPASRVTIDFTTLEDQTVTVRERDSMSQIRLHMNEVPAYLLERVRWDYSV